MQKFKLYPVINGTTDYSNKLALIEKFVICNSLENGLPFGYMDVVDNDSILLSKFENLQIGASVDIKASYDEGTVSDTVKDLKIEDWVILRVQSIGNNRNSKSSTLRVYFGSKMFLYNDNTNHCFEPMTNDLLVRQILKDKTRGCEFRLVYADAPDNTPIKRYKIQESDWEFLKNKVEAFSSYKKTPMYLYSDLNSNFYFKSIATMFNENPSTMLYYSPDNKEDSDAYDAFTNMYKTDEIGMPLSFDIDIGNRQAVSELSRQFIIFDNQTNMTFSGVKGPTSKIENDGSALAKYYPIDYAFSQVSDGSSIASINNHQLEDAYNMLNRSLKDFDRMFTLHIKTQFNSSLLNVGSCVAVFFSKGHWAKGKWILLQNKLVIDSNGNAFVDVEIARPTFSGSKSKTTLENFGALARG